MLPEFEILGFDYDGCIDEQGRCAQWVLDLCQGTYAERSPSGRGVHALFRGIMLDFKNHAEGVEVFHANGFLTLTGDPLPGSSNSNSLLLPLPDSVREVIEGFRPSNAPGIYPEGGDRDAPYLCTDIGEPTLTHLKQALDFLPSDDRDRWSRFAHALKGLKLFAVLPPPEMNAQGEDAQIATLCAPLPKLIAPSPTSFDSESA